MAETVETAMDPKTIPPAVFKNGREVKKDHRNFKVIVLLMMILDWARAGCCKNVNVLAYTCSITLSSADVTIYSTGIGTVQCHFLWGEISI